jgi:thiamine-phosphate pyrophosphorylase
MDRVVRIIDANANRAREALRVMEDTARFVLDHQDLCAEIKQIRHDLRLALDAIGLDRETLLANRDAPGDVGTGVSTGAEMHRDGVRGVATAAASRLTEALRAIEECAKSLGFDTADQGVRLIESIRYRAYDAERRLTLAFATGRATQWKLCVLITESLCDHLPWTDVAKAAADAGADCLQLREKDLTDEELLSRAERLVEIAHGRGASAVVNDRVDVALLAGADAVHLGQTDLHPEAARRLAGTRLLIGVSTSSPAEARQAVHHGADYCGIGPMFETTTKHKPHIAGPRALAEYLADPLLARHPHLAIGGISPETVGALVDVGVKGVAVSSCVCAAREPATVCRRLLELIGA